MANILRRAWARWLVVAVLVQIGLLVACSSLPTIVPDLSRKEVRVAVESAGGPLSAAQSKVVLDRLKAGGKPTSIFDRHLAFEEAVAGTPLVTGNRVTLLIDGPDTYKAMFHAIAGAHDHINLETYILEDDETGQQFANALIAKQRAGVQVNLMYDSVGSRNAGREFFQQLRDAGVRTLAYNPVNPLVAKAGWDVNERDHRKLLVVDGRTAFVGGVNISSVYRGGSFSKPSPRTGRTGKALPWRDTHLQIDGPVVADLQRMFIDTWAQQQGDPATHSTPASGGAGPTF